MQSSKRIRHRSLPQLIGVLLVAAFAGLFTLYHVISVLDRYFTDHSAYLARQALEHRSDELRREAVIHARVAASYRAGGDTEEQLRALHRYYRQIEHEGVQVVTAAGRPLHGRSDSEVTLDDTQRALLLRNMDSSEAASGFLHTDEGTALVSAAAISPIVGAQGPELVVVLIQLLDDYRLLELGFDYGLADLHFADGQAPIGSRLQLNYLDGSPLIVSWTAPTFGRELLRGLLPIIIGSVLLLALLVGLIARDAIRTASKLVASYNQLNASRSQLETSEKRFRDIAEAASDWLWETDAQLRLVYLSGRFEVITRYAITDWLGRPLGDLLHGDDIDLEAWMKSADTGSLRCHYNDRLGTPRISQLASRPIIDDGICIGYRGAASDITERVREQSQIEHMALHDPLTGLANRARFQAFIDDSLVSQQPLVILSLDLDRFKAVNDNLGHAAGDAVLKEVSERLLQCTRSQDLVARLGGDEFIMILCGHLTRANIDQLCTRVIDTLGQPIRYQDRDVLIGTSIGIAIAPDDAVDSDELLRCADIALYRAKHAGRETWRYHGDPPA